MSGNVRGTFHSMIYLVDNTFDGNGTSPRDIAATLTRMCPDTPLVVERYLDVSLARVRELAPTHIVLSGQSHPWTLYERESLAGVFEVIREAPQPILGICGGHQLIAMCHGAPVALMQRLEPGEGYAGAMRERGFVEVDVEPVALFAGLPSRLAIWASHYDEVKTMPTGFTPIARNATCAIQGMQHVERPLFGVQFHPELFDDDHPHGRRVLENFLATDR
jgi:GMP synthase (glutamine-hydrolysing)